MKMTFAPPTNASTFPICFRQDLKAGGGASCRSPFRWYCPSSSDFSAGMGRPSSSVPRKAEFDIGSIMTVSNSVRFNFSRVSQSFSILPDLGFQPPVVRSTTICPFSAAAFAILPRLEAPMNTVRTALCSVHCKSDLIKKYLAEANCTHEVYQWNITGFFV